MTTVGGRGGIHVNMGLCAQLYCRVGERAPGSIKLRAETSTSLHADVRDTTRDVRISGVANTEKLRYSPPVFVDVTAYRTHLGGGVITRLRTAHLIHTWTRLKNRFFSKGEGVKNMFCYFSR